MIAAPVMNLLARLVPSAPLSAARAARTSRGRRSSPPRRTVPPSFPPSTDPSALRFPAPSRKQTKVFGEGLRCVVARAGRSDDASVLVGAHTGSLDGAWLDRVRESLAAYPVIEAAHVFLMARERGEPSLTLGLVFAPGFSGATGAWICDDLAQSLPDLNGAQVSPTPVRSDILATLRGFPSRIYQQ